MPSRTITFTHSQGINMILDRVPKPQAIPENIQPLCDELEKLLRIVNAATMPSHLDTAARFLDNLSMKWSLNQKNHVNLIYLSIHDRIVQKKNEFILMDIENADNSRI